MQQDSASGSTSSSKYEYNERVISSSTSLSSSSALPPPRQGHEKLLLFSPSSSCRSLRSRRRRAPAMPAARPNRLRAFLTILSYHDSPSRPAAAGALLPLLRQRLERFRHHSAFRLAAHDLAQAARRAVVHEAIDRASLRVMAQRRKRCGARSRTIKQQRAHCAPTHTRPRSSCAAARCAPHLLKHPRSRTQTRGSWGATRALITRSLVASFSTSSRAAWSRADSEKDRKSHEDTSAPSFA